MDNVTDLERNVRADGGMPSWLAQPQEYTPPSDSDDFITKTMLSLSSVLARLRLDDGAPTPLSPSAPVKMVFGLACILLVSLSRNYFFVLLMLSAVMVRACFLPQSALVRVAVTASSGAGLAFLVMLPAVLLGQGRAPLMIAAKSLVSAAVAMEVALSTPFAELTGAWRAFGVPDLVIMTVDLALRSIVRLGEVALEALSALTLRSVGHNQNKQGALGGVGGVMFVKAANAAQQTHDAMRCRGFEGTYESSRRWHPCIADLAWLILLGLLVWLFLLTQRQV